MHIYTHTHTTHIHTHTHNTHTYTHNTHTYTHNTHICTHTYTQHTQVRTYIHTHTFIHTYIPGVVSTVSVVHIRYLYVHIILLFTAAYSATYIMYVATYC